MKRSELEQEFKSGNWKFIALVVSFEHTCTYTLSVDIPGLLESLNNAVERGGKPVGFVGVRQRNPIGFIRPSAFATRVLPEYAGQAWAVSCLENLARIVSEGFEEAGLKLDH